RLKRKSYAYAIEDSIKEQVQLAKKAYIHNIVVDEQFYDEVLEAFRKSKESKYFTTSSTPKEEKELEVTYETISEQIDFKELSDMELERYIKMIENLMADPNSDIKTLMKKHEMAFIELKARGKSLFQESIF
ncbi:MAG: hypothetical protein PHI38_08690, partial [Sulfurimonas sp.]|nr:hypothetical protein [Sulfurimonas sp.]